MSSEVLVEGEVLVGALLILLKKLSLLVMVKDKLRQTLEMLSTSHNFPQPILHQLSTLDCSKPDRSPCQYVEDVMDLLRLVVVQLDNQSQHRLDQLRFSRVLLHNLPL